MVSEVQVTAYIDENILQSKFYDDATNVVKTKAINNAVNTLLRYLSDVYKSAEKIPIADIAEQVIWLLKMDDTMQRAEMGATMITVDGIQIQLSNIDRAVAPAVLKTYGRSSTKKSRVGSYITPLQDTFRMGV